ncbi:MAG: hypothetical protein FWF81_00035 [Defluviitaleaceae bacterium]|nr:hypothetical protein [Defluviitaleaceae bacterium]
MLENLKNTIHQNINELFTSAAMDEMTGDTPAYKEKLATIAQIADVLGIDTEITTATISLKITVD